MNIFVTRIIPQKGLDLLNAAGFEVTQYTEKKELSQEELISACKDSDALLSVGSNKIDEYFLQQCSHLKGIALMSVGYDNVDVEAATRYGVPVSNTPGVLSGATADVAFLLMLAVSRNAFYMHNSIGKGDWGFYEPTSNLGQELNGKTLGVLGLGRIGTELAQKCKAAYYMNVIYHNRNPNAEAEQTLAAQYVSFESLLKESDVLSVHVNLTAETKGLFDKSAFNQMKPSAIFINTARGAIHNENDLLEALENHIIWGAGLDVTNPEPMNRNHPLLSMPNVCVLPHIGSATVETRDNMAVMAAKNIIAVLQNQKMPQTINPEVYQN
ncbi:2-hydroxyacid dehydrogenase [Pedobacter sp.]|uniref:2-hydroxyacid dehydrogenase n=1 Tax=Pedobacter sp. TaxID=1411316 RepID=UPI003D7F5A3E